MPVCEIHRCDMKLIPAGVSRKTGKPYNAFYACQVKDCQFRPPGPEAFNNSAPVQNPFSGANRGQLGESSDASIIRQVAFKGAIEMVVAEKIDIVAVEKYTNSFESILLRHKTSPLEEDLPTIQQGEDIPFTDDELPPL